MQPYADRLREDQRLTILAILRQSAEYTANEHALRDALRAFGHTVSADQLRAHLAWLDEQGCLVLHAGDIQIALLTLRGEDVATGAARLPGVARPRPPGF